MYSNITDLLIKINDLEKNKSFDSALSFQIAIFNKMTPAFQRISFVIAAQTHKYKDAFPSRRLIAQMSGCHESTVRNYIAYCEKELPGMVITHSHTNRNKANHYKMNSNFFQLLWLLKSLRLDHCWKKVKKDVTKHIEMDDLYLARRLHRKCHLSTMKLPDDLLAKLPAIKSLLYELQLDNKRMREKPRPAHKAPEKEDFGQLKGILMPEKDKRKLLYDFSPRVLDRARCQYQVYSQSHVVQNPAACMTTIAQTLNCYQVNGYGGKFRQKAL